MGLRPEPESADLRTRGRFILFREGEAPAEPALSWGEWPGSAGGSPSQFGSTVENETALIADPHRNGTGYNDEKIRSLGDLS